MKNQTRLSDFTFTFHFHALEKEKATHSSVLAWRIPGMREPGGLPSMRSHRVRHGWSDLAAAAAVWYQVSIKYILRCRQCFTLQPLKMRIYIQIYDMKYTHLLFYIYTSYKIIHPLGKCLSFWKCIHWKDWCWSWNSNTLATWCKELTQWKRPWCWERLKVGREGDDRGWDDWMASLTQWTWVWVSFWSWWWAGKPWGCRVRHDWATKLNWTELIFA